MERQLEQLVLRVTGAKKTGRQQTVQELWDGYGWIRRIQLQGGEVDSVIVKLIDPPAGRGSAQQQTLSHRRKLKSYRVESCWYTDWAPRCAGVCRLPYCYAVEKSGSRMVLVLEDLDTAGFPLRTERPDRWQMELMLGWLAEFHALFLGEVPDGLWKNGSYWHLDTRPDELEQIRQQPLRAAAGKLDLLLKRCRFKTILHGDAKPANFCFGSDTGAAAVDFQYTGGGCGMKDVAYLMDCYLDGGSTGTREAQLLDFYFDRLHQALVRQEREAVFSSLEEEWRALYPAALLDFDRFMAGWSPGWYRLSSVRERMLAQIMQTEV